MRPYQGGKKPSETRRRKPALPFQILVLILYGRHSSIQWQGAHVALVHTAKFAETLGTNSTHVRRAFEWLKRNKYLVELDINKGTMQIELRPPHDRAAFPSFESVEVLARVPLDKPT